MDERKEYTCKDKLRSLLIERRKNIADKPALSHMATERVLPLVHDNVMVYVSMAAELSTTELIEKLLTRDDVCVYVPYTENGVIMPRRLKKLGAADKLGNLDECCYHKSTDSVKIDMCVTPMLGFNADGYRIGYGKGCYDRFFAEHETYKIGLAFDDQRADFLQDDFDVPLDCCVTESGVLYFNK